MRPAEPLAAFVRDALAAGHSRDAVAAAAGAAGWSAPETRAALDAWSDGGVLPPVPRPRARTRIDAGDALRHAILFAALGVVVLNLGIVAFALVDAYAAPDPDETTRYFGSTVRYAVAALVVAWPVWAWQSLALAREAQAGEPRQSIGRWLTAIALFVAATVVICDAGFVLGAFLTGEATGVFLLKALVVGALAAAVFAAYRPSLDAEAPA